jgi:hypothetical protein
MNGRSQATDGPGTPTGAALFRQAQAGCRDSLARLMAAHEKLVHCGYCGSACSGGADTNAGALGPRSEPWRYYICGNQKRKGWSTCELGKVNAARLEQAVIQQSLDQVLTTDYLQGVLERLRKSHNEEQLGKALTEARTHLQELDRVIHGLVNAVEQRASSALMNRLVEREQERDQTLARIAKMEMEYRYYQDMQLDPASLRIMVDELRRGVKADHATVRDTLHRFVSKIEVKRDGGTLYLRVPPCALLSVSTPGGMRTTGPLGAVPLRL